MTVRPGNTQGKPVFVMRCAVCWHEVHVEWGPDTQSQARNELIAHVNDHSDAEIRAWAMPKLVGRDTA